MKCKIRHQAKWLVLAAILLSGCSGDDSPETGAKGPEICLNADVGQVKAETRLTTFDDDEGLRGRDIVLNAYFSTLHSNYIGNAVFSYDETSGYWKGGNGTHYYWPIDGSLLEGGVTPSLDFVGYWPADATDSREGYEDFYYIHDFNYVPTTGVFSFSCDMSSADLDDIGEFMYAITTEKTFDGGAVQLNFLHPFARIKFQLSDVSVNAGVSINTISVTGLKSQGSYTSTDGWKGQTGNLGGDIGVKINNTETEAPFVVPFEGTIGITVNANWVDWGEIFAHTVSTNIDVDWSPGTSYTYTLTITPTDLRVDVNKYTEQW